MSLEALELQIEQAWVSLSELPRTETRTLFLIDGRLVFGSRADRGDEIGTYGRGVTLGDLRGDVFWTLDKGKE